MVSLGFVKDAGQSPRGTPRVYLRRNASSGAAIRAWSGKRRSTGVELCWNTPSENPETWAGPMAEAIMDLGWRSWWLDSESVARVLGGTTQEALTRWGLAFWGQYRRVGSVYLLVGENSRTKISGAVEAWERAFSHVRYAERLDIDRQMRQKTEELQNKPVRRTLVKFFPALFKSL
ncbi:hypothetical protein [Desulfovibrio ferrophilus]|uniref:Uncharacterized protein n=1 Tax=Desulfovibrio ferrophilus TaxID=241368 RepID=A0A2Z6B0F2_9BACT|nr:hypothetical protein [Desulfovibrio ferrophilus]BBD08954.1 uncharacterized protein DFE_2228 [Desulfovibrio ferrophilus]